MSEELWVLWCLNEWDERASTLEAEISIAIKTVVEKRGILVIEKDPIYMDLLETQAHSKLFIAEEFEPDDLTIVQKSSVPGKHIQIPVIQREPVRYLGERESI
jgi:hypothetical protein